jgi:hypothetical protein
MFRLLRDVRLWPSGSSPFRVGNRLVWRREDRGHTRPTAERWLAMHRCSGLLVLCEGMAGFPEREMV